MPEQFAWRSCDKCFGMFFNGDPDPARKGSCPAGNAHHAQGFVFKLPFDVPTGQPGWSFCDKCFCMFFNGNSVNKGHCAAGGAHHAQGLLFALPHDVPETTGQPGWSFCENCFCMFFNGDPVNKGRCAAGGSHLFQGFLFVLPHIDFPHPSITLSNGGRSIDVVGVGFVPNQIVKIAFQIKGDPSNLEQGEQEHASDAAGHFNHPINFTTTGNISADVMVTDLGSGEVVRDHL